jgi:hypothetical protein
MARQVAGKVLLGTLAGIFVTPLAVFLLVLILNQFNPRCGTPGDSGGCEMSLVTVPLMSVLPGAAIGFVVGAVRGVRAVRSRA